MKILIAGAAGTLGTRVSDRLLREGHDVWGTTRARPDVLRDAGVRPVEVDLLDAEATGQAVASVAPEAIVQVLNALPPGGPTRVEDLNATNRIRIDGTRNLVSAASAAGVERYVAESFAFGYGIRPLDAPPVDESTPLATGLPAGMQAAIDALADMERAVQRFGGIVLRCGVFFGRGVPSTDQMIPALVRRKVPSFGFEGVKPFVHIDDAAAAVVAALRHGKGGAIYNVAGLHATFRDYVEELAASAGAAAPRRMPKFMARFAGAYLADMMRANLRLSTQKAVAELGWSPAYTTLRDGFAVRLAG